MKSQNKIVYSVINHDLRNELKLDLKEYILLDSIYQLQQQIGWCYATKDYLTTLLDVKERALKDIIDKLVENNWIERKDETNRLLRTTQNWIGSRNCNITSKNCRSEPAKTAGKLPAETADYNNIYNNNIIYKELFKINDKIYFLNIKSQIKYLEELLKDENIKVVSWYVSEFIKRKQKGGDDFKFFPKAVSPAQLLEKWESIKRIYDEAQPKPHKSLW